MRLVRYFNEIIAYGIGLQQTNFQGQKMAEVQIKLSQLFEQIKKSCLVFYTESEYQEALFAFCAWFDEMVLCSLWQDKATWKQHMLQKKYFNTTLAGEIFFEKLEACPPVKADVLEIYFYCLKLGFKGKYHSCHDSVIISEKSQSLYQTIIQHYHPDLDKPLANCSLMGPLITKGNKKTTPLSKTRYASTILPKCIYWLLPVIPFIIVSVVFNEVIRATAVHYFMGFS